ncbi:MAG: HD domain-containing protein [Terriglobia bacterium]|jgi:HD-GYP domain-containing protein (c-di-GMP phosphodiesterase class II)|nr:HD domain-containing protein [Terriglobia bacterium]
MSLLRPTRIPILYLILGVLLLVSVVPMYFYANLVVDKNRERLKTNEMLLQNTVTKSLSDDLAHRQTTLRMMLENLASAVSVTSGGDLNGEHVATPEMRALLEKFVSTYGDLAYATLLNSDAKGIDAGKIQPDAFLQKELEQAFAAAREGRPYTGNAVSIGGGKDAKTLLLVGQPLEAGGRFIGMVATVLDLQFLAKRLTEASQGGLMLYVVDRQGRLVSGGDGNYAIGQDMARFEIVRKFVEQGGRARFVETSEFAYNHDHRRTEMLGTYSPVPSLEWAVIAQKDQRQAYASVYEMQRYSRLLALMAVLLSVGISSFAARNIAKPLEQLTVSSRAIASGDFSQRVHVTSRTEIGELAMTFNHMTEDLERFVKDLKRAAEENRALFLNSIQMLAGAVDEKDPYTRGHSDRVTKYSVLIATEYGLEEQEIDRIRIAAQLHDVGKIGIEDRILKKPGALTPEEFEVMKTHTTKGANILRSVEQLREMLPGIELHHESLDGRGYPFGLKGDQIPLMPRIITVADTFDAMTTNRPYQAAMEPEYVIRIINSLASTKFDPQVVAALTRAFQSGKLRIRRAATMGPSELEQAAEAQGAATATAD